MKNIISRRFHHDQLHFAHTTQKTPTRYGGGGGGWGAVGVQGAHSQFIARIPSA